MQANTQMSQTYSHQPTDNVFPSGSVAATTAPLLELALTESSAQGAYVYQFGEQRPSNSPVAWAGLSPTVGNVTSKAAGPKAALHFSRTTPLVLQENAWTHPAFEAFAEFRTHRFEGVASIPLLGAGETKGIVNICRSRRDGLKPREFAFLMSLSSAIASLLNSSQAQRSLTLEVERLAKQLSDRKILDRAKGLIQSRFDWTEEQAYFCIRNLSRRTRTPMNVVAQEIIETGASRITDEAGRP